MRMLGLASALDEWRWDHFGGKRKAGARRRRRAREAAVFRRQLRTPD